MQQAEHRAGECGPATPTHSGAPAYTASQPVNAPATMIPSMPRLSTPARSHSSTPSVPRISGVAMRSTATQKAGLARMSTTSVISLTPSDAVLRQQRRDQHRDQRHGNDHVGDVGGHADRAAHGVGADQHAGHEDAAASTPSGCSPASMAMTMPL